MPDEDDDSDSSCLEILDGGSDMDICEESELARFSQMLSNAQKNALAKKAAKGNKRKTYNGRSRTTVNHKKHFQKDLAAQGFLSVHGYRDYINAKKEKEKLKMPTFEESEESSEELASAASEDHRHIAQVPATSGDCCHVACGPAANDERCHVTQGPVVSGEHHRGNLPEEEEESTGSKDEDRDRWDAANKKKKHGGHAIQGSSAPRFDGI
jgi:hypothetical protein